MWKLRCRVRKHISVPRSTSARYQFTDSARMEDIVDLGHSWPRFQHTKKIVEDAKFKVEETASDVKLPYEVYAQTCILSQCEFLNEARRRCNDRSDLSKNKLQLNW